MPHHPNVVAWPGSPRRTHPDEALASAGLHCVASRQCSVASECTSPPTCRLLAHVEQPAPINPTPMRLRRQTLLQRVDEWLTPRRVAWLSAAFVLAFWGCLAVWKVAFASVGPL